MRQTKAISALAAKAISSSLLLLPCLLLLSCPALALTPDEAGHLLRRTGFGPKAAEVQAILPLNRAQAVDKLLSQVRTQAQTAAPTFAPLTKQARNEAEQRQRRQAFRAEGQALKIWWLSEMLATPSPLTETMTLFWHNHFTSALKKVRAPGLMYAQNRLLRQHALGSFAELLRAIPRDPAMLRYLDGAANRKAQPNENFARELLELFTLGEGHYSEADIKAAARAFSGWGIDQAGRAVFKAKQHDAGAKTFLGQTGNWQGEDIIRILLAQPGTSEYVVSRLWRQLISPTPNPALVKTWASSFRKDYAIKPLLRTMLSSDAFWAPAQRGTLIKSPLELTVGSFRSLGLPPDAEGLLRTSQQLGQDPFDPPNVKGWPGGPAWIDSRTLVARQQFLTRLGQMDAALESARQPNLLAALMPLAAPGDMDLLDLLLDERYQLK